MSYDIGIGTCIAIEGALVRVGLDRAMVPRLVPSEQWARVPATLLLRREQCSTRHLLQAGAEVWLDSARLDNAGHATLDLGRGERIPVDLGALIRDTEPAIPAPNAQTPPAPGTPRVWQTPHTASVRSGRAPLSRFR